MSSSVLKVSLGTAGVLGLLDVVQLTPPTTAYLMVGERCSRDCAFCAQARTSQARVDALSRIIWPPQDLETTLQRVAETYRRGRLQRVCLQVTAAPGYLEAAEHVLRRLWQESDIPLSASVVARHLDDVRRLFDAGASRLALALDAATPAIHRRVKGGGWQRTLSLLEEAAQAFPGRMSTHLIVGLGEREEEMAALFQWLTDRGILIGLFAFTPVPGTALESRPPPSLAVYRRLQVARLLIVEGHIHARDLTFDRDGRILGYGFDKGELCALLADGRAFQTAGCPGCNRPYYNERPGDTLYNYPRPLTPREVEEALDCITIEEEDCLYDHLSRRPPLR